MVRRPSLPARLATCAALLALLAGCASQRPHVTVPQLTADGHAERHDQAIAREAIVERLVRRIEARGDRTLDIVLLSGGGQGGAYGAGFLRGWKQRADAPMPSFDVVTGISAGALLAPFAMIGSDSSLDYAAELYRTAVDRIQPSIDPLYFLKGKGGVLHRTKFVNTVHEIINPDMASRLHMAFAADRTLLIGTTDLDLGTGRIWDGARELDTTAAGLDRFRNVLIASSAIPGAFNPVLIGGHAHSDGGVATNLLLGADLTDFRRLGEALEARGFKEPVQIRLWVVVNLWVHPDVEVVNERSVGAIRTRGTWLMYFQAQQQALTRLWELSNAVTTGVPGLRMEMRYTAVPDSFGTQPAAKKLFDRAFMERLEQTGFERAQGASPWDELPVNPFARPG